MKIPEIEKKYHESIADRVTLQIKLNIAIRALEIYANEKHWSKPYLRQGQVGFQVKSVLHNDGGMIAKEALGKIK